MKYQNTKTGAIIDSPCKISGGDWVVYQPKKATPKKEETPKEPAKEIVQETNESGITKRQIMQELDAMGVDYDKRAKKDELYNLMMGK